MMKKRALLWLSFCGWIELQGVESFTAFRTTATTNKHDVRSFSTSTLPRTTYLFLSHNNHEEEEVEEDDDNNVSSRENDWRDFRAQLVQKEQPQTLDVDHHPNNTTTTFGWAYDSGNMIEQGSIILASPHQDFSCGLAQQYFHKSVILVLEHEENSFTKGIVLNRPTNWYLQNDDFLVTSVSLAEEEDDEQAMLSNDKTSEPNDQPPSHDESEKEGWHLWYGGEVQWIDEGCELTCLHSLSHPRAREVSSSVLSDSVVQYTSLEQARDLVREGHANVQDFWLFGGYVGWDAQQLSNELARQCWYMVATDAQTVWKELRSATRIRKSSSPVAGLEMWQRLMTKIGRNQEMLESCQGADNTFADTMLHEWSKENLLLARDESDPCADESNHNENKGQSETEKDFGLQPLLPGTLLRACSKLPSPFLLSDQFLHKSIVLVTQDEESFSVGVVLNHPLPDSYEFLSTSAGKQFAPIRYGGRFGLKADTEKPTFCFHCSSALRSARVGSPLHLRNRKGIWKCSFTEARDAILAGTATENDFMVVQGVTVWPKFGGSGLDQAISCGIFEPISFPVVDNVWKLLQKQERLTSMTMDSNLQLSRAAWQQAEQDATFVQGDHQSGCTTNDLEVLCDEALRRWVQFYLLGYDDTTFDASFG